MFAYHFSQGTDFAQPPVIDTTSQQNFIDERILPAEELRAEELRLQAALEPISPTSPSPLAEGDYMADEDFNMMISSSAAASSGMAPAILPTPKGSAKELRADDGSAMRTESEEFAEKREGFDNALEKDEDRR